MERSTAVRQLAEAGDADVIEFARKIDIYNSAQMMQYGNEAQKKIAAFSESALSNVRAKDMGEIGGMISGLVMELKGFSEESRGGVRGLFKKSTGKVEKIRAKYDTVEKNVDKICSALERHRITLLKDITMLDKMYDMNQEYYRELTTYIKAGRYRLREIEQEELPVLREQAGLSEKSEDAYAVNELAERANRFDKKLHDLELTQNICQQMAPQIRLVQGTDMVMAEKIQSSIANTIPLWKNQMVLTLGLSHAGQAMQAQRQVTDMTNELLRKNADMLKISAVEVARESERGIVDLETLQYTNQSLIATLDEVLQIQNDGSRKRREAEEELCRMEEELKSKLLALRDASRTGEKF